MLYDVYNFFIKTQIKNKYMNILKQNTEYIVIGRTAKVEIALITLHFGDHTMDTVLVSEIATTTETELIRKIVYQYAEDINIASRSGKITSEAKAAIFKKCFDEYQLNPKKELTNYYYFKNARSRFIKNTYSSAQEAIDEIIRKVKETSGISISVSMSEEQGLTNRDLYTVSINDNVKTEFTFWNSASWPTETSRSWDLHIIPEYHPCSPAQGRKSYGMLINGSTDALIRSEVISSVYSPETSRKGEKEGFGSSWNYMKHPYKVTGKSFQFTLRGYYHQTKELVDDAVELILTSLDAHPDGNYIGISGGFYPSYDFPENIANRTGKKLPTTSPRGSEQHCMWTYDVLKEENQLEKAHIPSWFYDEKWIEFFKDEKRIFPNLV